jgi:hypothetical protein
MSDWQPIDGAPKDGSTVTVKRVYEGDVIYEGPAAWRTVHFPALSPDPLNRHEPIGFGGAETVTGWMHPDQDKRVPEPTHFKPL